MPSIDESLPERRTALGVFEAIGSDTHEEVLYGADPVSGLQTIIAIHSTALGPALGGTRFFAYASESDALTDVLRLAKAMSYKAAAAGLDLGGGKGVIIGDPRTIKTERLMRAYGRVVDSLGGRYVTAEDVGTTARDMLDISRETRWVTGIPEVHGGSGDPSPATARGVMAAMRSVAVRLWDSDDLSNRTVAVQGVGKVGSSLAQRLTKVGATVVVADVNDATVAAMEREYGAHPVPNDEIYDVPCDIFAPCALGGSLNETTIPRLQCRAVVGAANNQLATEADADRLAAADILYAPDFVVNAGGIINITEELRGYSWERAAAAVDLVGENLSRVFTAADSQGTNPNVAAVAVAQERMTTIGGLGTRRRARRSLTE
jgi:glutamate dehydrogenase/leucine dehydrogenase